MTDQSGTAAGDRPRGGLKSSREFGAGLFLLALAAVALAGSYGLRFGQLSGIGPGLMPKVTAVMVAAFGLLLMVQGIFTKGEALERWAIRGPIFVIAAVVAFAVTVRPLGLIVAGPLAVVISALADKETGTREIVIFATTLTALCGVMFKDLLALPIPFDPMGIVPDIVASNYVLFKKWLAATLAPLLGVFKR